MVWAPEGPSIDGYWVCALESAYCSFDGTADVAFGAQGSFNTLFGITATTCNDEIFGDPLFGILKACYFKPNGP
jgi:hypothetical protein